MRGIKFRDLSPILMVVFAILAFSIYKLIVVDRLGFCYKRVWFVSNDELVLRVLDGLMKQGEMKLDASDISPEAYLAHHPNCCSVNWGTSNLFGRGLMYFGSASVLVSYEMEKEQMNAEDKGLNIPLYYDSYSNMTSCGEYVGSSGSIEREPIENRPNDRR